MLHVPSCPTEVFFKPLSPVVFTSIPLSSQDSGKGGRELGQDYLDKLMLCSGHSVTPTAIRFEGPGCLQNVFFFFFFIMSLLRFSCNKSLGKFLLSWQESFRFLAHLDMVKSQHGLKLKHCCIWKCFGKSKNFEAPILTYNRQDLLTEKYKMKNLGNILICQLSHILCIGIY